jgi:citrate lyase subunit beta / citryl-CoA lyase
VNRPIVPSRRRSALSVPASSERKLEKALGIDADELVLDLEDAVVPAAKDGARAVLAHALALPEWSGRKVAVRVNAPRTPWCHHDLIALAALTEQPHSIVLPKVESPGDLAFVDRLLDGAEAGRTEPLRVQALIETAAGLARVGEIAAAGGRLEALILGYADLGASLGRSREVAPQAWLAAQDAVLLAARAHGLQAIDGPYLGVSADDGFLAAATHARDLGFDGKWAIHPSQVGPLNELFSPSDEEMRRARAVLAALEQAERDGGAGAVELDGEMLDEALGVAARRVLARTEGEER